MFIQAQTQLNSFKQETKTKQGKNSLKKSKMIMGNKLGLNYKSSYQKSFKRPVINIFLRNLPQSSDHNHITRTNILFNQMHSHDEYDSEQFENQNNDQNAQQYLIKQKMRKEAYNRETQYTHPPITFFDHQQINSKQSEELRKQLVSLYKPKVQLMRNKFDLQAMEKDYENNYQDFIKMTLKNQIQQRQISQSIIQMHSMAQILLNPPDLKSENLFLYSKNEPISTEQQQIDRIFRLYQIAYKQGVQVQENHAQQTIKRAKQFLRDRYA